MRAGPHVEQPVWIALNGVRRIVLSCSPHDVLPLALGHVIGEGWVRTRADVLAMNVEHTGTGMGVAKASDARIAKLLNVAEAEVRERRDA